MNHLAPVISALLLCLATISAAAAPPDEPVQFSRDVLPILSANCFSCHGPDENERQADLRLDVESDAKQDRGGTTAIIPGDANESGLMARLTSANSDEVMPPPDSGKQVDPHEIDILRRWINEGAPWERHWAFVPPVRPPGTLDDQVRAKLDSNGLTFRPAASPHRLARRLSLDLTGLPPTPRMGDELAADPSPRGYARLVDQLLESPHFGEHWARMWLDLARFADTKGYEKDLGRTMWPYRDWVIDALNADMPLDQFTLEQLAGDLITGATESQRIATAFHRNTMANDEGGTDDEEFRVAAVKDRVNTTVQVWMGLTMGCAQCHTHKYDPISIVDYYRFYAIFNQTEDADRFDDAPRMEILSSDRQTQRETLRERLADLRVQLQEAERLAAADAEAADSHWTVAEVTQAESAAGATLTLREDKSLLVSGTSEAVDTYEVTLRLPPGRHTALRLDALPVETPDGKPRLGRSPQDPNFVVSELAVRQIDLLDVAPLDDAPLDDAPLDDAPLDDAPLELTQPRADFSQEGWSVASAIDGDTATGWGVSPQTNIRHWAIFDFAQPLDLATDAQLLVTIHQNYGNQLTLGHFRLSTSEADPAKLLAIPDSAECQRIRQEIAKVEKRLTEIDSQIPQLPIMRELADDKRRQTRIHLRGSFLDPGDPVDPAVLSSFHPLPESIPVDRLGVARWLVRPENPLTPRVGANRIWARLFGRGLVETEEDFGTMGSQPSNAALLDWLAAEYRDNGWSLKNLLRTIVTSETYRQTSDADDEIHALDPRNEWISRGARFRLDAEVLRDQALTVSGLLSRPIGGPSVMPPQPDGLWRSTYNGQEWIDAEGANRFRRGLYTYLKRTTPYPSFTTFDGGSGEVCLVRRIRTNTPLQTLITMNDPVFLEAAAALAERMVSEESETRSRAERGMRLALIRPVHEGETTPLLRLRESALERYQADPQMAKDLIAECRGNPGNMDPADFAGWIVVANAILNLDEFLTRN